MDHVIDRHLADQPAALVDHGGGDQRVFLEHQRDLFLIHLNRDQRLVAFHHVGQRDLARRGQNPAERAGADRVVRLVDHEDFEEIAQHRAVDAQVIDQVADRQVFRHGHELAAHQAPGGFFRIGQRAFDRGAALRLHFGKDRALVGRIEILDQLDRVVGLQLVGNQRHRVGGQRLHHFLADPVVQLGDHFAGHQVADRDGQVGAFVGVEQFEEVGHVGGVERFDQLVDFALAVFLQRKAHGADIFGLEPVFLVVALVIHAIVGAALVGAFLHGNRCRVDCIVEERVRAHGLAPKRMARKSKSARCLAGRGDCAGWRMGGVVHTRGDRAPLCG